MVEAVLYRYRWGIARRDRPEVFGPRQTVWTWRRMAVQGTGDKVLASLAAAADAAGPEDWSLSVDSTIARAHQHAANTKRLTRGWNGYANPRIESRDHEVGRSRGGISTKIHQLVDGKGLPLVALLTPGQGRSPADVPATDGASAHRPRSQPSEDSSRGHPRR